MFNIFRRRKPIVPLSQLCYDVAYFVLRQYLHDGFPTISEMRRQSPEEVGPFFYEMACELRGVEPDAEIAKTFQWHAGVLNDSFDYLTLSYPTPSPIDMSYLSTDSPKASLFPFPLAPYFSTFLQDRAGKSHYYILGQAPFLGGTTLRCIKPNGDNCNLGRGPTPTLEAYHAALAQAAARESS